MGGGSRNDLLCALTQERTGLPVRRVPVEASAIGVLLQLAVASGHVNDLSAARDLPLREVPAPDPPLREVPAASPSFEGAVP